MRAAKTQLDSAVFRSGDSRRERRRLDARRREQNLLDVPGARSASVELRRKIRYELVQNVTSTCWHTTA